MSALGNLYAHAAPPADGEHFDELFHCRGVRVERIVSSLRPDASEYDQPQDEWVVLLRGSAELDVAGTCVKLTEGDYVALPAHTKHRVLSTSNGALWLAVHVASGAPAP